MPGLVLDSLEIENFRGFRHLTIDRLARVNLLVGKNNVGKTSVLEAIRLYSNPGAVDTLVNVLASRDEVDAGALSGRASGKLNLLPILNLFHGREVKVVTPPAGPPTLKIGKKGLPETSLSVSLESEILNQNGNIYHWLMRDSRVV